MLDRVVFAIEKSRRLQWDEEYCFGCWVCLSR